MSYQTRKTLFEQIENSRQRPLISYVTSIRPNLSGNMTGDSIDQIIAQIQKIPEDKKEIDFLIISNGGDPITALRIISILRERFNKISVLLPYLFPAFFDRGSWKSIDTLVDFRFVLQHVFHPFQIKLRV